MNVLCQAHLSWFFVVKKESENNFVIHPVSLRRFPSFRTQPLENLSRYQ